MKKVHFESLKSLRECLGCTMKDTVMSYILATSVCYFPKQIIPNHIVRVMAICKLWFPSIFNTNFMNCGFHQCASHPLIKLIIFSGSFKTLSSFWNSSVTTFLCLPDDIISEIFTRVPADQLTLMKGVCKRWHSLISHPDFVNLQLVRSRLPQQQILIFPNYTPDDKLLFINMQDKEHMRLENLYLKFPLRRKFSVRASCGGLLLLVDQDQAQLVNKELYIYNPATTKYLRLPDLESRATYWTLFYDNDVEKYGVFATITKAGCKHAVLTVGEDNWRWLRFDDVARTPAIYVKNKLHWVTRTYCSPVKKWCIRSMDVANMELMDAAISFLENTVAYFLSEVGGSLCLTTISRDELQLAIFVLESSSHGRWTKKYSVNIESLKNLPVFVNSFMHDDIFLFPFPMKNVGSCDFSDLMKIFIYNVDGDKLIFYDMKCQELRDIGSITLRQFHLDIFHYCLFHSGTLAGV